MAKGLTKQSLTKKNKVGRNILSDFKSCCKAIIINSMHCGIDTRIGI